MGKCKLSVKVLATLKKHVRDLKSQISTLISEVQSLKTAKTKHDVPQQTICNTTPTYANIVSATAKITECQESPKSYPDGKTSRIEVACNPQYVDSPICTQTIADIFKEQLRIPIKNEDIKHSTSFYRGTFLIFRITIDDQLSLQILRNRRRLKGTGISVNRITQNHIARRLTHLKKTNVIKNWSVHFTSYSDCPLC